MPLGVLSVLSLTIFHHHCKQKPGSSNHSEMPGQKAGPEQPNSWWASSLQPTVGSSTRCKPRLSFSCFSKRLNLFSLEISRQSTGLVRSLI